MSKLASLSGESTREFRLVPWPDADVRSAAFELEARTFGVRYGVPYDTHVLEFLPYESASAFLVVVDERDQVAAAMRLITPGPAGLKTLVEAAKAPWWIDSMRGAAAVGVDPHRTWDVGTLAAAPGLGQHRFAVTAALYHGLTLAASRNRVKSLLMTVDERVRGILQTFGLYTSALPNAKPAPFEGSPASTPVYGHCAHMLDTQRRVNPEAYRLVTQGVGLNGVHIPPAAAFTLPQSTRTDEAVGADAIDDELALDAVLLGSGDDLRRRG
jgi:hypothetical protein